jgi:hypothetical protein
MSLSNANNRNDYVGNGSVDTYNYTFRIFDDDDIQVIVRDTDDVETVLTKTTHYTVTGVGSASGGTIPLVNGAFDWIDAEGDLKSGYVITIRRIIPLVQETDIRNQGAFYPEIHEDQFDKLVMIDQQQQDDLDRSLKMATTVLPSAFDTTIPASIVGNPGASIIVNPTGDGLDVGPTVTSIAAHEADTTNIHGIADTSLLLTEDNTKTVTNKTFVVASNTFTTAASGNLAATELNAALAELQGDIDNRVAKAGDTMTGALIMQALLRLEQQVDSTTAGSGQSITPTRSFVDLTNAGLVSINNIASPQNGQIIILKNDTGVTITLINNSGGTAENRILTGTGQDLTMLAGSAVILGYDSNSSRWQVIGGSGGGNTTLFGSTGSPRSVVAATGITSGASHMSTTANDQIIFVVGSVAGESDISASPQITAGTIVGQRMQIHGTSDTDYIKLDDGTGLSLDGPWFSYNKTNLSLIWDGSVWVETSRRD